MGDHLHPPAETALAAAAVEPLPCSNERGLRYLVGVTLIAQLAHTTATYRGVVATEELRERVAIAGLGGVDEDGIPIKFSE